MMIFLLDAFTLGSAAPTLPVVEEGLSQFCSEFRMENTTLLQATCTVGGTGSGTVAEVSLDLGQCIGYDGTGLVCESRCVTVAELGISFSQIFVLSVVSGTSSKAARNAWCIVRRLMP